MIPGRAGGKKPKEEDTGVKNRQRDRHDGLDLEKEEIGDRCKVSVYSCALQ